MKKKLPEAHFTPKKGHFTTFYCPALPDISYNGSSQSSRKDRRSGMRIAICDNEKEIRDLLGDMVKSSYPEADLFFYASGEELLQAEEQPDILFLDIQMPGKNGMDTARELRKSNERTILIFVTGMEEYVFQSFDVGAFHYLVKPFTDEKFETVLHHAVEQSERIDSLLQVKQSEQEEKYIMVKSGGVHTKILWRDIIYAEVFNRKIMIHSMDGDIEYYGKMMDLEKSLGEDFFRPHRAYLIHFKYVVKYNASTVYLERGTALMAKQNYGEFVKRYLKYIQRKG